jgi:hypothetical protein
MAYRLERVTLAVAHGQWHGISSVRALARHFRCSEDEVVHLHKLATAKVSAARGDLAAQLEGSVAVYRRIIREEMALAKDLQADADAAADAVKTARNRLDVLRCTTLVRECTQAAIDHKKLAMAAQVALDKVTVLHPNATRLRVDVTAHTDVDFDAAFQAISRALAVRFPAANPYILEGLTMLEEAGPDGFEAWLAQQRAEAAIVTVDAVPALPAAVEAPVDPAPPDRGPCADPACGHTEAEHRAIPDVTSAPCLAPGCRCCGYQVPAAADVSPLVAEQPGPTEPAPWPEYIPDPNARLREALAEAETLNRDGEEDG